LIKKRKKKIIDYSRLVNSKILSTYKLNDNSLPHITILQFIMEESKEYEIVHKLFKLSFKKIFVNFYGASFLPSKDRKTVWIEISVERNNELIKLQNKVLQVLKPKKILNSLGNKFRPHITISRCDIKQIPVNILDNKILIKQRLTCNPCLGCGTPINDYTFNKIIHKFS